MLAAEASATKIDDPALHRILRSDGQVQELEGTATVHLDCGDTFVIETPGGGGYEPPD